MLAGQDTAGEKEGSRAEYSAELGRQGAGVKARQGWGAKGQSEALPLGTRKRPLQFGSIPSSQHLQNLPGG